MTEIRTKFLFRLALDVGAHHVVGPTPFGSRRVAPIAGGTFEGPQLSGIVLPGGTDWITEDAAGGWFRINVHVPLRTRDGELLTMAYQGFRSGPPEVLYFGQGAWLRGAEQDHGLANSHHVDAGRRGHVST